MCLRVSIFEYIFSTTRFVVTMEGLDPAYEDNEFEDGDDSIRQNKMAERCKFWPNCKNGDTCPFHHPTVPCRYVCVSYLLVGGVTSIL